MNAYEIFLMLFVATVALFLLWFAIVSVLEKELLAVQRSLLLLFFTALLFLPLFVPFSLRDIIVQLIDITLVAGLVYLLFPFRLKKTGPGDDPCIQIDERDIMFARSELVPGTERFEQYYKMHPENRPLDDEWRKKAGLMSPEASLYHRYSFAAADAGFSTVEALHTLVEKEPVKQTAKCGDARQNTTFLKSWIKHIGAIDVGVTMLKDYHLYSHVGRGDNYGKVVGLKHRYAIAFTVEMDKGMMDRAPKGPCVMESALQYLKAGVIATQVAECIRNLGYNARAHIDANYRVICPLVARDAGLGEIGRMGLLMTPNLGPRVRIGVVTTDFPLMVHKRVIDTSVSHFCTLCKKCADVCPSQAIPNEKMQKLHGALRWQINSEACYGYWCTIGTDCGRCMGTCPYSHPDNLLHNIVRWGIKYLPNFRKVALLMDDYFYGRKPKPAPLQQWMG